MSLRALYMPSDSYTDEWCRKYAGWTKIYDYQRMGIERAGFEVIIPEVPEEYIDKGTSFAQIASYSLYASQFVNDRVRLIAGGPSYMHHSVLKRNKAKTKAISFVWNNADWHRDIMLKDEYVAHNVPYRTLPINTLMNEMVLREVDCVVSCCEFVKDTHIQIPGLSNKIKVAFWGVDSEMFTPPTERPPGFRILYVCTDPARKGLRYLLNAIAELDDSEIEIWMCGSRQLKIDHSAFTILNMVPHDEMPDLMRRCHILVLPTLEDGLACCVQEAMACGVVPITTDTAAEPFDDKRSGFKVPYRDSEQIVRFVRLLKESPDLLLKMSRAAREKAETQTWEKYISALASIVKRVCE